MTPNAPHMPNMPGAGLGWGHSNLAGQNLSSQNPSGPNLSGFAPGLGQFPSQVPNLASGDPRISVGNCGGYGCCGSCTPGPGCSSGFVGQAGQGCGSLFPCLGVNPVGVQDVVRLAEGMSGAQVLSLAQYFQEQVRRRTHAQPDLFGQVRSAPAEPFTPDLLAAGLPLPVEAQSARQQADGAGSDSGWNQNDPFSRTDKWIGNPPQPSFEKWRDRESEVLNWAQYVADLSAWASQASLQFGTEILQASRWSTPIRWSSMTLVMRSRSMRLLAILRSTFMGHPRSATLIHAFMEGVDIQAMTSDGSAGTSANGYELLRQLTQEYSLRTRNEALVFRTALASKSFVLTAQETSPSSLVSDTVRRIELEAARYQRLLSTLPSTVDAVGLQVSEADLLMVLVRSLPETVRNYVLHHAEGESYQAYRSAACRWEQQQRMFTDLVPLGGKKVSQVTHHKEEQQQQQGVEWFDLSENDENWFVDELQGSAQKCGKCGSKKHQTHECSVDLTKIKCFRCNQTGHVSMNCPQSRFAGPKGKGQGKGSKGLDGRKSSWVKQDMFKKGKFGNGNQTGKGKGGKKGKLNEIEWTAEDLWWDSEESWWGDGSPVAATWSDAAWHVQEDWHSGWVETSQDGYGTGGELGSETQYRTDAVKSEGNALGSLILSPVFVLCDFVSMRPCLELEPPEHDAETATEPSKCPDLSGPLAKGLEKSAGETTIKKTHGDAHSCHALPALSDFPSPAKEGGSKRRRLDGVFLDGCPVSFPSEQISGIPQSCHASYVQCGLRDDKRVVYANETSQELCALEPLRIRLLLPCVSTFLNETKQTLSVAAQSVKWVPVLMPLLSEMVTDDNTWWLLDSGACATVMSSACKHVYMVHDVQAAVDGDRYRAANGSQVHVQGEASVSVWMMLRNDSRSSDSNVEGCAWKKATLRALVGNIRHNILSTTRLCAGGWKFSQSNEGFQVTHSATGQRLGEVAYFAGCPWVRLHPVETLDRNTDEAEASGSQQLSLSTIAGVPEVTASEKGYELPVYPLSRAAARELEQHRAQGHTPFHPGCVECARGRSVFSHRRRSEEGLQCEIQADFCYLKSQGEILEDDQGLGNVKILVLTELVSNAVGYIVVTSDLKAVKKRISKWLELFGLASTSGATSVVLHTDAEQAVGDLISDCSERISFLVRKANPQQHRSVGAAERAVRRLKESLGVLRADLNKSGADLNFTPNSVAEALTYLALVHNHFGKTPSSDFSPLETVCGRRLSKPTSTLYGATVLAELPDAVRFRAPNETRSIEAAYLHAGLDHGPKVQGFVRFEGQLVLHQFVARNVRPILPLKWDAEMGAGFITMSGHPIEVEDVHVSRGALADPPQAEHAASSASRPQGMEQEPRLPLPGPEGVPVPQERKRTHQQEAFEASQPKVPRIEEPPFVPESESAVRQTPPSQLAGEPQPRVFQPTRFFPACDTGMVAPGIRHSAQCRRRRAAFDAQENLQNLPVPLEAEYTRQFKRAAETAVQDLEETTRANTEAVETVSVLSSLNLFCFDSGESLESLDFRVQMTSPTLVLDEISAIQFDHGKEHVSKQLTLGGGKVLIWCPDHVIDDSTLEALEPKLGFEGMLEEIGNLEKCKAGKLLSEQQMNDLKRLSKNTRVIPSRWVCAKKSPVKVRTRIVAKDIKRGTTARAMGYSSPTPSVEGLFLLLSLSASRDFRVKTLDISHAFMHSPLPSSETILLRLPLSVSLVDGSVAYLHLDRALNGLRDASLRWLNLLSETVKSQGLWSDELEPCIYQGEIFGEDSQVLGVGMLMVYVDDILLCTSTEQAERSVISAISAVVPTKVTGQILPSDEGGGKVSFIGRHLYRRPQEKAIFVAVDPRVSQPYFQRIWNHTRIECCA